MKYEIREKLTKARQFIIYQNYEQAEKCLLEIKNKTIYACYMLDNLYQKLGKEEESLKLEIECANKGYIKFIDILRVYYLIKYDLGNAYKYTLMGIRRNDPYSVYYLAESYHKGLMTELDYQKAYNLYFKFLQLTDKKRKNYIILSYRMKAAFKLLNLVEKNFGNGTENLKELKNLAVQCTNEYYNCIFIKNKFDFITKDIEKTSSGGISLVRIRNINNPNYIFDKKKELHKYFIREYCSHTKVLCYLEKNYFRVEEYRLTREIIALYNVLNYLHKNGYDNKKIISDDQVSLEVLAKEFTDIFESKREISISNIKKVMKKDLMTIAKLLNYLVDIGYLNITQDGKITMNNAKTMYQ